MLCVRLKVSPHHFGRGKGCWFGPDLPKDSHLALVSAKAPLVSGPSFFLFTPRVAFWSGAISAAALGWFHPSLFNRNVGCSAERQVPLSKSPCAQHVAITRDHAKDQYISPLRLLATGCFTKWPEVVVALFAECQSVVLQPMKNDERLNFLPAGVGLLPFNSMSLL